MRMPEPQANPSTTAPRGPTHRRWAWGAWGLTGVLVALGGLAALLPIQGGPVAGAGVTEPTSDQALDARGALIAPTETVVLAGPTIGPAGGTANAIQPAGYATPLNIPASMFNGKRLRAARTMEMVVTAYSPDERSCGKSADGITASGMSVWTNGMKLVAADTTVLPMRSILSIPGYNSGKPVPVLDRGGAIKGNRLDVLFPTHEAARKWGRQKLTVIVWEYVD